MSPLLDMKHVPGMSNAIQLQSNFNQTQYGLLLHKRYYLSNEKCNSMQNSTQLRSIFKGKISISVAAQKLGRNYREELGSALIRQRWGNKTHLRRYSGQFELK